MTRSEQKRLAIINAAREEFTQHGFNAANMNNVSRNAEVSKRTLYRHFESKELLFEAVLEKIQQSRAKNTHYPFKPEQSLHQQLTDVTLQEIDMLYKDNGIAFSRTVVMEFFRQPEMARTLSERLYQTHSVTQWFEQAMGQGALIQADSKLVTDVYLSLFNGLFFWPQVLSLAAPVEGEELKLKVDTLVSTVLSRYQSSPAR